MSGNYKTYNKDHSVYEVVWKFTFNKKISNENFEEFKNKNKDTLPIQKIGYTPTLKIIDGKDPSQEDYLSAFKEKSGFLAWNSTSGWIIEVVHEVLLIKSRRYLDWDSDFKIALEFAQSISSAIKDPSNFIKNILLMYDDRFSNVGGQSLEYSQLFKSGNEFIPSICYSKKTKWQSQCSWFDTNEPEEDEIFNQLYINSVVDPKDDKIQILIINHACSFHIKNKLEISNFFKNEKTIFEKYSLLHETNKEALNRLLTEEVLIKINYLLES